MTDTKPNLTCAIVGMPKSGKTHLALTFPDPIKVYSFDLGCQIVAEKFPDKVIDIVEYPMPIVDTLGLTSAGFLDLWKQVRDDIKATTEKGEYKTLVIDTASALWEIIRYAFNEEEGRAIGEGGKARRYGEPNARMYGIITRAQVSGMNLVLTNYLKDRWANDVNTGEKELDGWRRTEGLVDVVLLTERVMRKTPMISTTMKDCRFSLDLCGYQKDNFCYNDLAALLGF
ncbi:unnamed protein product [marine sediment metagenome]|uniref:Uncharacterized protein n=1 Tax=marine sediment metagenome TaxID=412755 RepID=X1AJB6_9ZZZZ